MYQNSGGMSHHHQQSHHSGQPPTKKPRGNPIITKYPPPPGYQGPAQFGHTPTWQQPQSYALGQPGFQQPLALYQAYSHPRYGSPTYPSQHGSPSYPPQFASHGYPPQSTTQGYPPQPAPPGWPSQPALQGYPPQHAPGYPPPHGGQCAGPQASWQYSGMLQGAPSQSWSSPLSGVPPNQHHPAPAPSIFNGDTYDGNGDIMPPLDVPLIEVIGDDLEHAFDAEPYYARNPAEINPDLSLGMIEWKPPLPTLTPLPSTFKEAELEVEELRNRSAAELASMYVPPCSPEDALRSVRESDYWDDVQGNIIYEEFAATCTDIIQLPSLLDNYRYRFDPAWAEGSPTPEPSRASTPAQDDLGMEIEYQQRGNKSARQNSQSGVLEELEKAIWATNGPSAPPSRNGTHSRTGSVSSQYSHSDRLSRPKPLPPLHSQRQEEVLAALGVTGTPKLVYETPPPALGPPPTNMDNTIEDERKSLSEISSVNGARSSLLPPRPVPRMQQSQTHHPWEQYQSPHHRRHSSSANSQHTDVGPGFDNELEDEATPRPKLPRIDSRKRSYADWQADAIKEEPNEDNDDTPRQRRKIVRAGDRYDHGY